MLLEILEFTYKAHKAVMHRAGNPTKPGHLGSRLSALALSPSRLLPPALTLLDLVLGFLLRTARGSSLGAAACRTLCGHEEPPGPEKSNGEGGFQSLV